MTKNPDTFSHTFTSGFKRSLAANYSASLKSRTVSHEKSSDASSDAFYDLLYGGGGSVDGLSLAPASPQDAQLDKRGLPLTPKGENSEKKPVNIEIKDSKQISRWRLKHTVCNILRSVESEKTPSVCRCGTSGYHAEEVTLVRNHNGAGVKGVLYCDSPWLCPTCAPRRAAERAEKVQKVFSAAEKKNGQIVFVTLTVGHSKKHNLSELKHAVNDAGRKAREGKPWKLAQGRYDIVGTLVSPEVTYSIKHGWHYHLHLALIVLNNDQAKAQEAGEWLIGRYMNYIKTMGFKTSRKAQDVTVVWREEDLAEYMAKGSAAWEVASAGATKDAARGSLSPWDLAANAGKGDSESSKLFLEYADVMPGTKACVITKKIADVLEISADEEEPEGHIEEAESEDEIVGVMPPSRWHKILRNGYAADVLKVTSAGWKWGDIDNLISRMLNEGETNYQTSKEKIEIVREHKLSDDEFIEKVKLTYYRLTGGKKTYGRAVQVQLDEERSYAVKHDKVFILPDLKNVMSVLSD